MRKLLLGLLMALLVNFSFSQEIESLDYCNCKDKIDQAAPVLNGKFERRCNNVLIEQGQFINGQKNGDWITYSKKGKLIRKVGYKDGRLHGKVELFYVNGKPKVAGNFEEGQKTGKWTYYTDKGLVLMEGNYTINEPVGIWVINDKKGKKAVTQYDYDQKKYIVNTSAPLLKDGAIIQNENTEEWYILRLPNLKYPAATGPLGGYGFANYMFAALMEVPLNIWDTYLYQVYKITYKISPGNSVTFESQPYKTPLPPKSLDFTLLMLTNPAPRLKRVEHSALQHELLEYKIKEALSLMPPWIYNGEPAIDVYLHYGINDHLI
ncbi:hypothetical protein LQ567_24325 [Niabella pedocola]|uniref:MORN repeat protein n=1 Tax=Niabella pedocola TaxID=1752077 RepID=A0ABS8PXY4_9BACT|nr:hypothetical protein [Niabella pedocola]MCD2425932.1 hypothetical protein [Niabella pedocola]